MSNPNYPRPGEVYRHFKGARYVVICLSLYESTRENLVTYRGVCDSINLAWTRTVESWLKPTEDGEVRFKWECQLPIYSTAWD